MCLSVQLEELDALTSVFGLEQLRIDDAPALDDARAAVAAGLSAHYEHPPIGGTLRQVRQHAQSVCIA